MAHGHEEGIKQRPLHRIIKPGLKGKHIGADKDIQHQKASEYSRHQKLGNTCKTVHLACKKEPEVKCQKRACSQQDHPYNRGLHKILLKGMEKVFDRTVIFIPDQFQSHIVHSRCSSSRSDNWNGTHNPQNVQKNQISQLSDKAPDGIVIIKQALKHNIPSSFLK